MPHEKVAGITSCQGLVGITSHLLLLMVLHQQITALVLFSAQ